MNRDKLVDIINPLRSMAMADMQDVEDIADQILAAIAEEQKPTPAGLVGELQKWANHYFPDRGALRDSDLQDILSRYEAGKGKEEGEAGLREALEVAIRQKRDSAFYPRTFSIEEITEIISRPTEGEAKGEK